MNIQRLIEFSRTTLYGLMYSLAIAFLFYNTLAKPEAEVDFVNLLSTVGAVAIIMV
ncbi:MAG: hypothetical protein ACI85U_001302, partial [Candidatus Promineifilaceae bacterium]